MQEARDPVRLGKTVVLWLYLGLAASLLAAAATAGRLRALSGMDPGATVSLSELTPELAMSDLATGISSILSVGVYLIAGFLTLKWIYRASRNAHALAEGLTVSPPWAVGWFFVPFANFLMPFRALREAWQASENPAAWRTTPVPSLVRWWWALWLISNGFSSVSARLTMRAGTVVESLAAGVVDLGSTLLNVALTLVFVAVVTRLSALQHAALERRTFD